MPPGMPWAYGQSMSMRNPMSRAPMNNNPMGNQAPMQPSYAPGVSFQQAASNVMMQQPTRANTSMRPLNMPGMQFDANQNAMVRQQRPQLTVNPNPERWGNLSAPSSTGGMINPATQRMNTRIARAGRMAGVRPGDMAQWRQQSPAAIAMRNASANAMVKAGSPGGQPAQMGTQMGPAQPVQQVQQIAATKPNVFQVGTPQEAFITPEKTAAAIKQGRAMPLGPLGNAPGSMQSLEATYQQWRRPGNYGDNSFGNSLDSFQTSISDTFNNRLRPWLWRQLGAKGY